MRILLAGAALAFAASLTADAAKANGRDKQRLEMLAATIKGRVAALR